MHEIRTIAIDDPGVCQSVCHAGGLCSPEDPRNIVLDGVPIPTSPMVRGRGFNVALPNYIGHLLLLLSYSS